MSERRFRRAPGGVSSLGLHVVWCPKYRRRILGGRVARRLGELLAQIADEHGWQIVVKEVMPDHVHLFVRVGPTDAPALVARAFKGRTARVLRCEFAHLRNRAKCCGRRRISRHRSDTSRSQRCDATSGTSGMR